MAGNKILNVPKPKGLLGMYSSSTFKPGLPKKYLNTVYKFPSVSPSTPPSTGTPIPVSTPPIVDLLYMADGYVINGYV
jgi:hypothetical protein